MCKVKNFDFYFPTKLLRFCVTQLWRRNEMKENFVGRYCGTLVWFFISRGTTATRLCPVKSIAQSMVFEVLIYLLSVFGSCLWSIFAMYVSTLSFARPYTQASIIIIIIIGVAFFFFFSCSFCILFFIVIRARTQQTERKKRTRKEQENEKQCVRWTKSHVLNWKTNSGTEREKKCRTFRW